MFELNEALLVLQHRDLRVAELERELTRMPAQDAALQKALTDRSAGLARLKAETMAAEAERKRLDLEAASKRGQIARYKQQQLQTRKNEEYAALAHEIVRAEKDIHALEDEELELMQRYETGLAATATEKAALAEFEAKTTKSREDLKARKSYLEKELADLRSQQKKSEEIVPEEILDQYRRILKSKKDAAIVPVRHGVCNGCHMKLTMNTSLRIRTQDTLQTCTNCGRFVYWEED
ncbi:MAG: zinc ribbon domain-containing protein [Candidatus Methylacidiphilales bacterium]|nr:C4-type zinc ribbon domain-containing protein [Candidatus Methylacidiphilales bacterium]